MSAGDSRQSLRSPYRGIEPFRYVDREYYFGQLSARQDLYAKILLYRLVVLFGESGAGKSSLLNAAIIPAVQKDGLGAERLRVRPDPEQPISVERIPTTESKDGDSLPSIFADGDSDHLSSRVVTRSLQGFLRAVSAKAGRSHPLLIFDQFEELFTLFEPKEAGAGGGSALQRNILDGIVQIVGDQKLQAKVVIIIREDFLGKLEILAKRYPQVLDHRVRLRSLTQEDAREAILGPFGPGDNSENCFHSRLAKDLAKQIAGDVSRDALDGLVAPTQIQIVCRRLWDTYSAKKSEIGVDEYNELGGVTGIVKGFFESELRKIDEPLRPLAITILGNLITDSGTRDIVGEGKLRGLISQFGAKAEDVSDVLRALEARRLLNLTSQRGTYFYEVSSEYLIPPIQKESQQLAVNRAAADAEKRAEAERQRAEEQARLAQAERERAAAQAQLAEVETKRAAEQERLAQAERRRAEQQAEQARRFRRLSLVLGAVLLLAVGAIVFALWQRRHATTALIQAQRNEAIASVRELIANCMVSQQADPEVSVLVAAEAITASIPLRNLAFPEAEDQLHHAILASHVRVTLLGHNDIVNSVAWSPDGKRVTTGSSDQTAKVWDAASGQELLTLKGHDGAVLSVAWSPDGKRVTTGSSDQTAKVWDAASGQELLTLKGHDGTVLSVAWSPDGKRLATGSNDETAKVWDAASGQELLTLRGHNDVVNSVVWSPDGKRLATGSNDETAKVWDAASGHELLTLHGHAGDVWDVVWSPDGKRLAMGGSDKTVVWNAASGHELLTLRGHNGSIFSVAWSSDGKRLATGSADQTAKVWDAASGQELLTLRGHNNYVNSVAWSPDGKRLATGSNDKTAKMWDTASGQELLTLRGHNDVVNSVAWSPDGKRLATGSSDKTAKVWDAASGQELLTLRGHNDVVNEVAWSPDGKRLATGSNDETAKMWDAASGHELLTLRGHNGSLFSVAWSPDGKRLATGSNDETAKVWDAASGHELLTLHGHNDAVLSVVWSSDGKRLATGSADQTAKVWDAASGQELLTLKGHNGFVLSVAWSPDGKRLATGSVEHTTKVWDAAGGQELLTLKGHNGAVLSVAWSPDGKRLATGSNDETAKVWDTASGQELLTLRGHSGPVHSVAWSPDAKWLATGSDDRIVQVYVMDIHGLMELARQRVTPHPSDEGCKKYLHVDKCPPFPKLP